MNVRRQPHSTCIQVVYAARLLHVSYKLTSEGKYVRGKRLRLHVYLKNTELIFQSFH